MVTTVPVYTCLRRGVLSDETNVPVRRGVSEVTHDVPSVEVDLIL